ncbi:MAG: hypothetical protein QM820_43975 [Minicystis sp.]
MPPRLFCGDALCKAPLTTMPRADAKWPVHCGSCGAALYPADVLGRTPPSEAEPKRAELMTERGGLRVPVESAALTRAPAAGAGDEPDVDRILAMVDMGPLAAPERRPRRAALVGVVVVVLLIVALAVVVLGGRGH